MTGFEHHEVMFFVQSLASACPGRQGGGVRIASEGVRLAGNKKVSKTCGIDAPTLGHSDLSQLLLDE